MRIRINDIYLTGDFLELPRGLAVNGQQVVDEVQFFRAIAASYFGRGNRSLAISWSIERTHDSVKEAQVFLLTHYKDLPNEGDVVFECGFPGDTQNVVLADAVLEAVAQGAHSGRCTVFSYTLRGGQPSTDIIPGDVEVDEDVTRRSTVAIGSGETSVDVGFANAMTGTPTVVAVVVTPDGGDQIFCTVTESSISASGFSAVLSGPAPGSGYKLSYIAIL